MTRPAGIAVPRGITVTGSRLRSANVEHDITASAIQSYVLTSRGADLLRRVANAISDSDVTRAWAVTGPYGTGKSSFAVLLAALLCGSGDDRPSAGPDPRAAALALLSHHDNALADKYRDATKQQLLLRAAVTARREPVIRTVARALHNASAADPGLAELAAVSGEPLPAPDALLQAIATAAKIRPLLIMIDEFGKNLEYFAARGENADTADDLYFLQELAELAAGERAAPIYLLTFQHTSFADYATRAAALQRREWSKIQGRFHDIGFVDEPADVATLVAGSIRSDDLSIQSRKAIDSYGDDVARLWRDHGLESLLPADPGLLVATYPLHPLTIAVLPALCAALGQHDRTLAGFVTGDEPHTVARFLAQHDGDEAVTGKTTLATLKLPALYDYFAASVRSPALSSAHASRWLEIEARLSGITDLDPEDAALLKAAALLNVIDSSGVLRASAANLTFATHEPQQLTATARTGTRKRLQRLSDAGYLTYRRHSDEYRLWAGTDIDIRARLQAARDRLGGTEIGALLTRSYLPPAIVAGKHSQVTGLLRHFTTVVTEPEGTLPALAAFPGPADGTLVLHLGTCHDVPTLDSALPILVGVTSDADDIRDTAADVLALDDLLAAPDLDPVARAEIRERLAAARSGLTSLLARAYDPSRPDVTWTLQLPGVAEPEPVRSASSLSGLVSAACETAYENSPHIRNEMLGRHQLTSQGAKARRELLTALIRHPDEPQGGLEGHGPEVAMHAGVVMHLGLHGRIAGEHAATDDPGTGWTAPGESSTARPAFMFMLDMIRASQPGVSVAEVQLALLRPPYGVKAGLFPIILTAGLMHTEDDVAVFEDGSFTPRITPEFIERLTKTPDRVLLRHAPAAPGQRAAVIIGLSGILGITDSHRARTRTPSLVRVTAALLEVVRSLSRYGAQTRSISATAQQVREALRTARDPEHLLFADLPQAVGLSPISADTPTDTKQAAELVARLADAVRELRDIGTSLERAVAARFIAAMKVQGPLPAARRALAMQADGITTAVVNPPVRALLNHAKQTDLPDDDWLAQTALIVGGEPMPSWRDENLDRFAGRLAELTATIARLFALHFDASQARGESFDARRVTVTRPDGREEHLVVTIPLDRQKEVDAAVEAAITAARQAFGDDGERILLTALATHVLEDKDTGGEPSGLAAASRTTAATERRSHSA
ncbi:MAG TPA: hypothetical protein VNF47_17580 [Streptosporangiaceae bacterium]|nr:hypothetical protein [Streptosporangiaceae bacterium]